MTRRERLLALMEGKPVDRIPVSTYGLDRYSHSWMERDPTYKRILEYTDEHDHIFAVYRSYYASLLNSDILALDDPEVMETTQRREGGSTYYSATIHTPKGDLTCGSRIDDSVHTTWVTEYPIKSDEDVDKFLSLPFKPRIPDVSEFRALQDRLGDRGLVEVQVPDPLCIAVENMIYEDFMVRTLLLREKLFEVFDLASELILGWLEELLKRGFGLVFRIFGGEYGSPPYMPPEFFREVVVGYDKRMIDLIHKYGCYARFHCHGPLLKILDDIMEMDVDLLDPCEAPPNGDVTLKELATYVGDRIVLMGNIQLDDIERGTREDIDKLVAQAIDEAGSRARYILLPTACPFSSPLPKRTEENEIQFIESGMKYGTQFSRTDSQD